MFKDDRADRDRDARVRAVGDATYVDAKGGNTQGAELKEIFDAFCDSEFIADWEQGVAQHGDAMHRTLLARSDHHNRWRARGYSTTRGPDGEFHHYRPNGTEIGWRADSVVRLITHAAA